MSATHAASPDKAAADEAISTSIGQLAKDPKSYDGRRIVLTACLRNEMHGVYVINCDPPESGQLRIVLSPGNTTASAIARYKLLFPSAVAGGPIYETRLTGIFKIGNPAPGDHWGSKYAIQFEADAQTRVLSLPESPASNSKP